MLGSQGESVESTHIVQHSDGHMRQPTQRCGKRLCLLWLTACPADRPGDFGQHQIRHNDRQCLAPQQLQELATDQMARFALVKGVHPHTGIDRVHWRHRRIASTVAVKVSAAGVSLAARASPRRKSSSHASAVSGGVADAGYEVEATIWATRSAKEANTCACSCGESCSTRRW